MEGLIIAIYYNDNSVSNVISLVLSYILQTPILGLTQEWVRDVPFPRLACVAGVYAGWKCCLSWYWQTIIRARGRLFRNAPTRARGSFPNAPTRARDLFRNAPTRARDSFSQCSKSSCDSLSNVPIRTRMIASSKSVHSAGFFYNKYYFLSQYAFHVYVLIVLIKAWFSQHVAFFR